MSQATGEDGHQYQEDSQGGYVGKDGKRYRRNESSGGGLGGLIWKLGILAVIVAILANLLNFEALRGYGIMQNLENALRFHKDRGAVLRPGTSLKAYAKRYPKAELETAPALFVLGPGQDFLYKGYTRDKKEGASWVACLTFNGPKKEYFLVRIPRLLGLFGGPGGIAELDTETTAHRQEVFVLANTYAREAAEKKFENKKTSSPEEMKALEEKGYESRWRHGELKVYFLKKDGRAIKKFVNSICGDKEIQVFDYQRDPKYSFRSVYPDAK